MSADYCDIIKQGYVKYKSKRFGWSKRWTILRKASSKGPRRLEKYDCEKSAIQAKDCKCINLTTLVEVTRLSEDVKKFGIKILFTDESYRMFTCDSDFETEEWLKYLQDGLNSNSSCLASERINGNLRNLDEVYNVYLCPSPKIEIFGECLLQITNQSLRVLDVEHSQEELISWPLGAIRKYNKDANKFTIETGRHCTTGEAIFIFSTVNGDTIYNALRGAANAIAATQQSMKAHTEPLKPLNRPVSYVSRTKSAPEADIPGNRPTFNHSTSLPTGTNNPNKSPGTPLPCIPDEVHQLPTTSTDTQSKVVDGGYLHQTPHDDAEPSIDEEDDHRYENAHTLVSLCRSRPTSEAGAVGGTEELDYNYEEKHLSNNFRKYLHSRKDQNCD